MLYILWYAGISSWSQRGQYEAEVAAAKERYAALVAARPSTNPFRGNAVALAEGKQVFETICLACHLADGTGLVGPSLVDRYWKYGHGDAELLETVNAGRPLGMPPWGAQVGPEKIWQVLAYIETLPLADLPDRGERTKGDGPPAAGDADEGERGGQGGQGKGGKDKGEGQKVKGQRHKY